MPVQTTTVTGQQSIPEQLMPYFTGASGIPGLLPKAQETFSKSYETTYAPLIKAGLIDTGATPTATMPANYGEARARFEKEVLSQQAPLGGLGTAKLGVTGQDQFGQNFGYASDAQAFNDWYNKTYGTPTIPEPTSGRVAPLSTMQRQVGTELGQMQTPTQFGMGMGATGVGAGALSMGLGALSNLTSPQAVQQYMSPYMRNVLDVQKEEAIRDAQKAQLTQNLGSVRQGTYGGARQLLGQTEATRNLQTKLGQIEAQGMQAAFDAAQKAQLAQAQQYGQFGQQLGALGDVYTRAGTAQQASDIDRLKTMGAYGDLQRALQQQQIDARYQDLLRQIEFPREQLGSMADILRGVPITKTGETSTTTTPPPSFASQLAGLGLSGLSLYNLLK